MFKKVINIFLLLSISYCCICANIVAAKEPYVFQNLSQRDSFIQLTKKLRCTVCQNQTLYDSMAPLAADLKHEIYQQMQAGQSSEEVIDFLVSRYGNFVLYQPPMQSNTIILWLAPLMFLLLGGIALWKSIK